MSDGKFDFPWEPAAMRGDPMPGGLSLLDQMAFAALRNIYAAYRRKEIPRAQAKMEKTKVLSTHRNALETWNFWGSLAKIQAERNRDVEAAASACRKQPTPENALRLCDVLDGLERRLSG